MSTENRPQELRFDEPFDDQDWLDIGADLRIKIRKQFYQLKKQIEQLKAELKATNGLREMDIKQCMRMNDEIQQLKSKLEKAKKGLEFYANGSNWQNFDLEHEADPECEADYEHLNPERPRLITGGKKARQALKEINEG